MKKMISNFNSLMPAILQSDLKYHIFTDFHKRDWIFHHSSWTCLCGHSVSQLVTKFTCLLLSLIQIECQHKWKSLTNMPMVFLYFFELMFAFTLYCGDKNATTCPLLEDYVKMCCSTSGSWSPEVKFIGQFEGCFPSETSVYTDTILRKNKQRPSKQIELSVANMEKWSVLWQVKRYSQKKMSHWYTPWDAIKRKW